MFYTGIIPRGAGQGEVMSDSDFFFIEFWSVRYTWL